MQVQIRDNIVDVPDYFKVVNKMLYNCNTKRFEGVDGDLVKITRKNVITVGKVKGYTNYQCINTYEGQKMVVSAQEIHNGVCKVEFEHHIKVSEITENHVQ